MNITPDHEAGFRRRMRAARLAALGDRAPNVQRSATVSVVVAAAWQAFVAHLDLCQRCAADPVAAAEEFVRGWEAGARQDTKRRLAERN